MEIKEKKESPQLLNYNNRFGFPYRATLSFDLLIKSLENKAALPDEPTAPILNEILKWVKAIPELSQPIQDLAILTKYRKEIDLMMMTIASVSLADQVFTGVIIPFQPVTVFGTKKFRELVISDEGGVWDLSKVERSSPMSGLIAFAGMAILEKYYGVQVEHPGIFKSILLNKNSGTASFFKPEISSQYAEVKVLKKPKLLSEIDLSPLNLDFFNEEFWLTNFPPDTFEFSGITIYRMIDVTDREMISGLEYALLETSSMISSQNISELQDKLRIYFKVADLRLGVLPMESYNGKMAETGPDNWFSFIPVDLKHLMMKNFEQSVYLKAIQQKSPLLISDLEQLSQRSPIEDEILRQGIRTLIVVPVSHRGQLIGVLELGSAKPHALNFVSLMKLKEIIPVFNMAFQNASKEFDMRVQAAIKEHFTAIHTSVEWKFVDAVLKLVGKGEVNEAELPVIELSDVTPLYGQIDIRGSSEKRNDAIRSDMIDYLTGAKEILDQAFKEYPLPILEELNFRLNKYLTKLNEEMQAGDEMGILEFIGLEVEPIFRMLLEKNLPMKKQIRLFIEETDPEHELHHVRRKDFEHSLNLINDLVTRLLDEEEERTQKLLPHYFEKYKTDGVEYNIYIGQSILEHDKFEPVFIKSFRLWQLINIVNIARATYRLLPQMKTPLETTQLILCYSNPLSIIFRMDEKRFDVTGAYNIRYEIVKKRIDKALVRGTEDRITQPNKIAIIYSQDKEAREYERYFEYLREKGLITGETEFIDVEPEPGLQGLKAMRIEVSYEGDESMLTWNAEELLKQVQDAGE